MPNKLTYIKLTFILICEEQAKLPAYLGSTLRGAMGNELRHISCTESMNTDCRGCKYRKSCSYTYFFSNITEESEGWMKGIDTKPNPYVVEPPVDGKQIYQEGDELRFGVVLAGDSANYLPHFLLAVENMARKGLGFERKRFRLVEVIDFHSGEVVYEMGRCHVENLKPVTWSDDKEGKPVEEVKLTFLTPYRFVNDGRLWDSLNFEMFLRGVFRRGSMLSACYCQSQWQLDFKTLLEGARDVAIKKADFSWHDWERYSNRSKSKIKMGGIVGEVVFKGDLTPYMPYIELGSIVHVGKGCTMGLGKYVINC